jgi:hypothetical protein
MGTSILRDGLSTTGRRALLSASIACILVGPVQGAAQTPLQTLRHHVRDEVSSGQAKPVGALPPTEQMNLSIILPLRNQAELGSLLRRLYDPSSSDYRHYLSVAEFTGQFGPVAEDYQKVVAYAEANGFTVKESSPNRLVVPISGTVEQVERAFNLKMKVYRHPTEERTFFSPDREPSIALNVPIAHIAGLNNYSIPRPMVVKPSAVQAPPVAAVQGSGPGGSYLGSDMRAAYYGGAALSGRGQTVGLVQFDGYNIGDVTAAFDGTASASARGGDYVLNYTPAPGGATYTISVNNILLDGARGTPGQFISPADDAEQALDIAQAIGMAPGLSQVRVYIGNLDTDILNAIAAEDIAQQVSISWTWDPEDPSADDTIFQELAAQGQSVLAASGDFGAFGPAFPASYPAEDEWVTAVGGTTLITNGAGGVWASETAWDRSGGGIGPDNILIPAWQKTAVNSSNGGSSTLRNVPDVAMEAGFDNYSCNMGVCDGTYAGTSFAASRWAGFVALVNQQAASEGDPGAGFLNPALYAIGSSAGYQSDFHDITSGDNNFSGYVPSPAFNAVPGYDLVTGWGSPAGQNLVDALAPPAPMNFVLTSSPPSLTVEQGSSASTTITVTGVGGFTGSVSLGVTSGLPSGVTASFSPNPANGTSELTLSAGYSASPGSYALNITGTSGALSTTIPVSLDVVAYAGGVATTILSIAPHGPQTAGTLFTLTASVSSAAGPVTRGEVQFCEIPAVSCTDSRLLGTAQLTGAGTATLLCHPPPGNHNYTAVFMGISNGLPTYPANTSRPVNVTVTAATNTLIAATGVAGDYTLTATVAGSGSGSGPTGTVSFLDTSNSNVLVGSASLGTGTGNLSFLNPSNPATGNHPSSLAVGDFNGDGNLDLAVTNQQDNTVTILLGNGDGTFTSAPVNPATGNGSASIAAGDFNGDGNLDLAVANQQDNTVTILLGNGNGTFTAAPASPATGNGPASIAVGDFNGDGNLDLAVTNQQDKTVAILLGNGDGTFRVANSQATGRFPGAIAVGVFNGSGNLDLAVANRQDNTVTILMGNGDGTFTAMPGSPETGGYPVSIAVGDFNGDGNQDLAVANSSDNSVTILLGNGDGTFSTASPSPAIGASPTSLSAGDFNGDGKLDLAVANIGNTAAILLGNGDGTFANAGGSPSVGPGVSSLTIGDFNGDGLPDLAAVSANRNTVTILTTGLTETATASADALSIVGTGSHAVVAAFSGDSTYASSVSDPVSLIAELPAATPAFSVSPGIYTSIQTVSFYDSTPGASIYYTTDGTMPTTSSTLYNGPITVASTETIEAFATAGGYTPSAVAIGVYTIILPPAPAPSFLPAAGTYTSLQMVSLSDAIAGVTIYYTTNGSTPTPGSAVYSGPITVGSSTTLQAIATGNGYSASAIASAAYVLNLPAAAAPSFSPAAGTYPSTQTVSISDATDGATIYYTTNGSTPTPGSAVYTGPITVSSSQTLQAIATANGFSASGIASAAYIITLPSAATPSFSPAAGNYTSAQTVTLTDATAGATIYYTTNGSTPTPSSAVYSEPIMVSSSTTLEAIATASGYAASAIGSAAYAINDLGPNIRTMSPAFASAGGANFTLTIGGSGFSSRSTVYWGAAALATHYVSAMELSARVPASMAGNAGIQTITVQTPDSGRSNAFEFEVDSAASEGASSPVFSASSSTVTPGATASFAVALPSAATIDSAICLNLPAGAWCGYSATAGAVSIATSPATRPGTYQVTVVFTEAQPGLATAVLLLPVLMIPIMVRGRMRTRGAWSTGLLALMLLGVAALNNGCGGGTRFSSGLSQSPQAHQVTSSGVVSLTVQ